MQKTYRYRHTETHSRPDEVSSFREPVAIRDCLTGQRYELGTSHRELTVGGASECDIQVTDPCASASHCSVRRVGERWLLRDHNSKNGTILNGTRVRLAELRVGNQIVIGDTRLEVLSEHGGTDNCSGLIGKAPNFLIALEKAHRAARTRCPVLILGETGTGKELIARSIHKASRRSAGPFVPVNCGAFPASLIRSELFGHAKGSFTGATTQHDGLFTQANGGTIFLDELGELPLEQQPHLLRALETRLIRRVGGQHEEFVNARFVSATNRNCLDTSSSPLRSDLFHRLSTVIIELPPLRERQSDIPILIRHFLALGAEEHGRRQISETTIGELCRHAWLGNIRELHNSVSRALALGNQRLRITDFLPTGIQPHRPPPSRKITSGFCAEDLSLFESNQRELVLAAYERHGTIRRAALELGMPKSTFADMCHRYGIKTSRAKRIKL
ncbi:MAG: sigma-54-dependent Fis family transcriptional regulator [Myxococcales bacterium]|nr:sigma-54-dependent Fis family transcriptional regulator [Myxococcales bacterium]